MGTGARVVFVIVASAIGFAASWVLIGHDSFRQVMAGCVTSPGIAAILGATAQLVLAPRERRNLIGLALVGLGAGLLATGIAILADQPFGVCLVIGMFAPGCAAVAGGLLGWLLERRRRR